MAKLSKPTAATTDTPVVEHPAAPPWETGYRFFGLTIVLLLAFGVLLFLAPMVDVILTGLLISFLMHTPCRMLARRTPLKPGAAVAVAYAVLFLGLTWLTWLGANALQSNIENLANSLNEAATSISAAAPTAGTTPDWGAMRATLQEIGASDGRQLTGSARHVAESAGEHLSMGLKNIVGVLALIFTAAFFSFFLQLGLLAFGGRLRRSLTPPYHREAAQLLLTLDGVWVGYATAMIVYCVLLTIGSFILFWLIGVPYPIPLAIFNGLITLIPSVGGLIGTVVTMTVCLIFGSTRFTTMPNGTFALFVALLHFVLVQVTYNFIALPVISRFVRLPVAVVLIGVLAALASGNIIIAFLVPPLFSTLRLVSAYIMAKVRQTEPFPGLDLPEPKVPGFFSQLIYELK